jgi:hypothetical protein
MKIIKRISNEISGNLDEAKEKIRIAYELKADYPEAAAWYREMAAAHVGFNTNGHSIIKKLIETAKTSDDYKRNPEYTNGMIAAWEAIHNDQIAKTAEVKALIDGWK